MLKINKCQSMNIKCVLIKGCKWLSVSSVIIPPKKNVIFAGSFLSQFIRLFWVYRYRGGGEND